MRPFLLLLVWKLFKDVQVIVIYSQIILKVFQPLQASIEAFWGYLIPSEVLRGLHRLSEALQIPTAPEHNIMRSAYFTEMISFLDASSYL